MYKNFFLTSEGGPHIQVEPPVCAYLETLFYSMIYFDNVVSVGLVRAVGGSGIR